MPNLGPTELAILVLLALFFVLYWLPLILAWRRDTGNTALVFLVVLLTGWTVVGWGAALYLALTGKGSGSSVACPGCGRRSGSGRLTCKRCGAALRAEPA